MIVRHTFVKDSEKFDHMVPWHCTAHGPLAFLIHRNLTAAAIIEPST